MKTTTTMLITVAGLCLASVPVTRALETEAPAYRPLRIVTLNVLHDGPTSGFLNNGTRLEERMDMVVRELRQLNPDIVALQEASQSRRHGDVAERVADELGLHKVFAPATNRIFHLPLLDNAVVGIMGFKEGAAILSRFPIVGSEVYDLPRCRSRFEPRILLRADLETPRGSLHVFSTHTARGDECQMERVGQVVREYRGPGHSILMGDFNTAETSKVLTILRDEAGFVDAFRAANPSDPGATVWQRIHVEQPTVSRRVDFIFLVPKEQSSVAVHSSRIVLDQPARLADGTALWPSDHYGVFAEVGWEVADDRGF
ncbi:MAG TPA: endonuclease/exonuclease/phosphatase family protein [Nitrospiraceae bacterium]|nr:endonuclease/exonuclease/phosphatase family protein [Nitrospiraceae bacterium]